MTSLLGRIEHSTQSLITKLETDTQKIAHAFETTPNKVTDLFSGSVEPKPQGTWLNKAINELHIPGLGKGCADKIGWIQHVKPPTTDKTAEFEALDQSVKAGEDVLPKDAKNYVYLAVGGLFSGAAPKATYFQQNLDALKAAGLDVGRVPVDTDMGVEYNAAIVRKAVLDAAKSGKKVVLIGHSMGGLDSAAALSLYPELKDKVRALVTIQSPYGGSPMANDLVGNPVVKTLVGGAIEAIGGEVACGEDLTYESRQAFLKEHPLPKGIPTVCMASSTINPLSPLYSSEEYLNARYGVKSDGLVCPVDAFIPGSETVTLGGLDHLDSTMSGPHWFKPYKPQDLTLSLVAMALKQKPAS